MRSLSRVILSTILVFSTQYLYANDSTAALGAGGLVLTKTDKIKMESEDLFISQDKIRVKYQFRNTSTQPITTRVAFPIPEFSFDTDMDVGMSYDAFKKDKNVMQFSVIVDGKKVKFETEDKVTTQDEAKWHKITHHWMQTFPANKSITVTHEYTPSVGGGVGFGLQDEQSGKYCITKDLQQWIDKQLNAKWDIPTATVNYILTSGANWQDGIGKFKLTVKKSSADEKISFCGTNVKKVDDLTFVMEKTNFTPTKDLYIIYFKKPYNTNAL